MRPLLTAIIIALVFSLLFSCSDSRYDIVRTQKVFKASNNTFYLVDSTIYGKNLDTTIYHVGNVYFDNMDGEYYRRIE